MHTSKQIHMRKLILISVLLLTVGFLQAQSNPSFSIIGKKEKLDGFANIRCVYVQVSNYDPSNPSHFEFIREYVRKSTDYFPDDFVHIYFFDNDESMANCDCGTSHNVTFQHLLASAYLQERVPDHNYKRSVRVTVNSMYGYNGNNIPKEVKFNYNDAADSYWK